MQCSKTRSVKILYQDHELNIKNSLNGLVEYTDLHYCYDGMLSATNMHIDADFNIRSYSFLELPGKKLMKVSNGIPLPKPAINNRLNILTTEYSGYRLVLTDLQLNVTIYFGIIKLKDEEPEFVIESENGSVKIDYYKCNKHTWRWTKEWFKMVVDSLEKLPPTKLGILIETLKYVYIHHDNEPAALERELLETVLVCHKVKFEVLPVKTRFRILNSIEDKYGEEKRYQIKKILKDLESDNEMVLAEIVENHRLELVYLIYLMLILENEGLIRIDKDNEQNN
jgi:hypothetical protein